MPKSPQQYLMRTLCAVLNEAQKSWKFILERHTGFASNTGMPRQRVRLDLSPEEKIELERLINLREESLSGSQGDRCYVRRADRDYGRLMIIESVSESGGQLGYEGLAGLLERPRATIAAAVQAFRRGGYDELFGFSETSRNPLRRPSLRREILAGMNSGKWRTSRELAQWLWTNHKIKRQPKSLAYVRRQIAIDELLVSP